MKNLQFEIPNVDFGGKSSNGGPSPLAASVIQDKYRKYLKGSRFYRILYYITRFLAALSAGLLPFVVGTAPSVAIALSIVIVLSIVTDTVFDPKGKWVLYSKATDLIAIAEIKLRGEYDKYKEALEILLATEQQALAGLKGLEEVLKTVQQSQK
jgi:hypothetical protein